VVGNASATLWNRQTLAREDKIGVLDAVESRKSLHRDAEALRIFAERVPRLHPVGQELVFTEVTGVAVKNLFPIRRSRRSSSPRWKLNNLPICTGRPVEELSFLNRFWPTCSEAGAYLGAEQRVYELHFSQPQHEAANAGGASAIITAIAATSATLKDALHTASLP
jgi:hypothetical protein